MTATAQPLAMILARNLIASVSLPAFLLDVDGGLVFFNDAAGALVGAPFEEVGPLEAREWARRFGPFEDGQPIALDDMPLAVTLREGKPGQGQFEICNSEQTQLRVDVSALPLLADDGYHGALVVFWRSDAPPKRTE